MNKKNINTRELKEHLFLGKYDFVDKWFKENSLKEGFERELYHLIIDTNYLFSFQSLTTDLKNYYQNLSARQCALIKNLPPNICKTLIQSQISDVHWDEKTSDSIFKCLSKKYTASECLNIIGINVLRLFYSENFSEINCISKIFCKDGHILNHAFEFDTLMITHKSPNVTSYRVVELQKKLQIRMCAFFALDYSEKKLEYLKSISLMPTLKEMKKMRSIVLKKNALKHAYYNSAKEDGEYLSSVKKSLDNSTSYIEKNNLDEVLPTSLFNAKKKLIKI